MFLKIGHRGSGAFETENTLESFRHALELGANAIELDVRRSKDGALVVSHDDNLNRVFGIDLQIHKATLKELKQATGGRIPTLDEALRFLGKRPEKILVELKETGCEKEALVSIKKETSMERVIIVSFHEEALRAVRDADSEIETGLIYARHKNPVNTALGLKAQYLLPLYRFTHRKNVEDAHKHGLGVIVWTINKKEEIEDYISKGVDGIASDRADLFGEPI
ncbi:MAG: glycerophosphodiester phosphodiesterase [Nitrospirae bacterium]|nr:glycerophosphodiester phosphodiesterase [Nitrospirota bacterium]